MARTYSQLDHQRGRLLMLGGLLLSLMCATLVLVSATNDSQGWHFNFEQRWPTLVGLSGLVIVFVLYVQLKHRELAGLEQRLRDLAVREATLQARFTELSFLFDTSTQLQLRLDLQSMLDLAVQRLISCLDAHQASIMLYDDQEHALVVKASAGVDSNLVMNARVAPGKGVAGHAFATGEALVLTPKVMRERFAGEEKTGRTIVAALCVPMRFRGHPIGVVNVSRASGEPFGEMHARILGAFAEHCAAAVLKTEHHQELLKQVKRAA